MYAIMSLSYPILYFLCVVLSESMCIFTFGLSSSPSNPFPMLFIHSAFLLFFLGCHILLKNCFASFASGYWHVFVPFPFTCWKNFLSLFWNVLFCLYCFSLSRYFSDLPSFASTFWFISSSCIVIFLVLLFFFCPMFCVFSWFYHFCLLS